MKHAFDVRRVRSRSLCVGTRGFCSGAIALPSTDNAIPSTEDVGWPLSADIRRPDMFLGEMGKREAIRLRNNANHQPNRVITRDLRIDRATAFDDCDDGDGYRCEYCSHLKSDMTWRVYRSRSSIWFLWWPMQQPHCIRNAVVCYKTKVNY